MELSAITCGLRDQCGALAKEISHIIQDNSIQFNSKGRSQITFSKIIYPHGKPYKKIDLEGSP